MQTLPEGVPTATLVLDRPRQIALTLGALRRIRETTGRPLSELETLGDEDLLEHLHNYLWSMLPNEDREGLRPEDVLEMLYPGNLEAAIAAFVDLVNRSMPGAGAAGGAGGNPPKGRAKKGR